jgi:hypothetical protein
MTWAAVAVGAVAAGSAAYGAKKSSDASKAQSKIAAQQQDMAMQLYRDTGPLRSAGQSHLLSFLRYGTLPFPAQAPQPDLAGLDTFMETGELPTPLEPSPLPSVPDLTRARRGILERQFQQARDNTVANAPVRGGTLGAALTQLDGQRALGVAGLYDQQLQGQYQQDLGATQARDALAQRLFGVGLDVRSAQAQREGNLRRALFSSALGLGSQQAQQALGGLANASQSATNVASTTLAAGQQQAQAGQSLGMAAALAQKYFKPQPGGRPDTGGSSQPLAPSPVLTSHWG